MPVTVKDLLEGSKESTLFLRSSLLGFLKKNSNLAYTLKEIFKHFIEIDKKTSKKYVNKDQVLYHLLYGYLREFVNEGKIVHRGHHYYYKI